MNCINCGFISFKLANRCGNCGTEFKKLAKEQNGSIRNKVFNVCFGSSSDATTSAIAPESSVGPPLALQAQAVIEQQTEEVDFNLDLSEALVEGTTSSVSSEIELDDPGSVNESFEQKAGTDLGIGIAAGSIGLSAMISTDTEQGAINVGEELEEDFVLDLGSEADLENIDSNEKIEQKITGVSDDIDFDLEPSLEVSDAEIDIEPAEAIETDLEVEGLDRNNGPSEGVELDSVSKFIEEEELEKMSVPEVGGNLDPVDEVELDLEISGDVKLESEEVLAEPESKELDGDVEFDIELLEASDSETNIEPAEEVEVDGDVEFELKEFDTEKEDEVGTTQNFYIPDGDVEFDLESDLGSPENKPILDPGIDLKLEEPKDEFEFELEPVLEIANGESDLDVGISEEIDTPLDEDFDFELEPDLEIKSEESNSNEIAASSDDEGFGFELEEFQPAEDVLGWIVNPEGLSEYEPEVENIQVDLVIEKAEQTLQPDNLEGHDEEVHFELEALEPAQGTEVLKEPELNGSLSLENVGSPNKEKVDAPSLEIEEMELDPIDINQEFDDDDLELEIEIIEDD